MANRYLIRIACIICIAWLCASAEGQLATYPGGPPLMQFSPNPPSPGVPEFLWTGPGGNLETGPGCVGNGDGDLPLSAQTPGGLDVDTPIIVPNIPNSVIDATGTHFYDVTLHLSSDTVPTDLQDAGEGIQVSPGIPNASAFVQPLTHASFTLYTTPASDSAPQQAAGPILLLSGLMTGNSLASPHPGSDTSATFGSTAALTGGAILNALNGDSPITVSWSIDLATASTINVNTGADIEQDLYAATIGAFSADATSLAPEPGGIGITAIAAVGWLAHSRRKLRR